MTEPCEFCGGAVGQYPHGCPGCSAPQCCQRCCNGGSPSIPEQFRRMRADLDRTAAERARADRAEAELEVLRDNQLGPVPDGPLKALGAWLADRTNCDDWAGVERYLNAALADAQRYSEQLTEAWVERDALRADAERYRWLRRKACIIGAEFVFVNLPQPTYVAPDPARELDAAIDAARGEG